MKDAAVTAVDHTLWQAIRRHAGDRGLTPEAWCQAQLSLHDAGSYSPETGPVTEDEILFDLTLRHFRELRPTRDEARAIGSAILSTLAHGEPRTVGPVGPMQRRYAFHRRSGILSIRVGSGHIRLPLRQAMCLAAVLAGRDDPQLLGALTDQAA